MRWGQRGATLIELRGRGGIELRSRRGATLIEVLVGCGVFAFLMVSSVAIMNIGTGGWRAVESKADVTRQLNRFETDITQELKRASLASVGIYTPIDDYRWAVWMKTPMNSPGSFDSSGNPLAVGDPMVQVTSAGKPVMQRYVVFYITRMDPDLHQQTYGYLCSSYNSNSGPDLVCPHKWIVKKDVYLLDGKTTGNDAIGLQGDTAAITNLKKLLTDTSVTEPGLYSEMESGNNPTSIIHRVQVVAKNILSFEITRLAVDTVHPLNPPRVSAGGPIILFDLKAFKALDGGAINVGAGSAATVNMTTPAGSTMTMVDVSSNVDSQGNTNVHTSSSIAPTFGAFTVQLDNRVIPQNP